MEAPSFRRSQGHALSLRMGRGISERSDQKIMDIFEIRSIRTKETLLLGSHMVNLQHKIC